MKQVKCVAALLFIGVITLAGCQDRLVMSDNSPFGEGVVRLGDTEVAEIDGTKIYLLMWSVWRPHKV